MSLALLAGVTGTLHTQVVQSRYSGAEVRFEFERTPAPGWPAPGSLQIADGPAGIGRPLIGAAAGLPAGLLVGAAAGYLTGPRDDPPDGCMFLCVPSWPALGGIIGAALGPGIGAHLLNGRRGNPGAAVLGSVAGFAGGVRLGLLVGDATGSTGMGVAMAAAVALGVPVMAEWLTSR